MKHSLAVLPISLGAMLAPLVWSGTARAQEASAVVEPEIATTATTATAQRPEARGDNPGRPLIGAGIFLFATSYLPATAVAASSDLAADQRLFVPVAGPWLDLARRGACPVNACSVEMGYRSLIVTDGILQGLGVLMTLIGLASEDDAMDTPARPIAKEKAKPVYVSPVQLGSVGYGVSAFGSF